MLSCLRVLSITTVIVYRLLMSDLRSEACRAGRAILRWSTADLARAARVSATTVNRIESGDGVRDAVAGKIIATFAAHGVEILGGPQPGARIKRSLA